MVFNRRRNFILIALALLITLIYVGIRVNVYHLSYELDSNLKMKRDLAERNRKLKVEVASLKAPRRIARLAFKKGLRMDGNAKIMFLKDYDASDK